jgi:beta-galactosidase
LEVAVRVPPVTARTAGQFILTCGRAGKEVFREVKSVTVLDSNGGPKPSLAKGQVAAIDPAGLVAARLQSRGISFTAAGKFEDIPATARVVVIGPDALTARDATDPKWLSLAARGTRVLVLDQKHPLHYQAIPADLTPSQYVGRVAFMENPSHPIFAGLEQDDFFTWSKDHVVYRNVYEKGSYGARSLAHCDEKLGYSAIAECGTGEGLLLLCQLAAGSKLAFDPVAQRLFDNMLAYCQTYQPLRRATAAIFNETRPAGKLLATSGLIYDKLPETIAAVRDAKHQIVIVDASAQNLQALAANLDLVKSFTGRGGWLFLWGLTPEGLPAFNKIVGVEHLLRPFERERVTLPPVRDPLLSGLTMRDVVMSSGETIMFGDKFLAGDVFTHVVDYDDIAPFCEFPPPKHFYPTMQEPPHPDNFPRNMVNGFTAADSWMYIFSLYPDRSRVEFDLKLPREETTLQMDFVPNAFYNIINKIELTYDGDEANKVAIKVKPEGTLQSLDLPRRKAKVLHVKFADWEKRSKGENVIGVDNMWIKVQRSPEFYQKVQPLLNIGALVKYAQGPGGVLLCQLNILKSESVPENSDKKKYIVTTLLRNLGAPFAGAKLLVAGQGLKYSPIALDDRCNQYLTGDKAWFGGNRDLRLLPVGLRKFAGVEYLVRDFKTSPLHSCVMLAGPGVPGTLPNEVKDLPVAKKADALFFLHAFNRLREWQAPHQGDKTPPVLFKYVVRYADGKTADVPVRYADGVDHWVTSKEPAGLKNATVAWAAPLGDGKSDEQAVVYQMQWNNPRPEAEIKSVDLCYDPTTGGQYGVPALLAISAAVRVE